jgi:EGF-like domain
VTGDGGADAGSANSGGDSASGGLGGQGTGGGLPPPSCIDLNCKTGVCIDEETGPRCECPEGFGGAECDDTNECVAGTGCLLAECYNGYGTYYCGCDASEVLTGESCSDLDECDYAPCSPDAVCGGEGPGFTCTCKDGFFGNGFDCVDTDPCSANPCGDGATCVATSQGAVCQCPLGKAGPDCSTPCDTLAITDGSLAERLYLQLGKYPDEIVPAVDLVGRVALDLSGSQVRSLDGLECWPTLERLNLNNAALGTGDDDTPLAALAQLPRLKELYLSCADEPDLTPLAGHPSLEVLNLSIGEFCGREVSPVSDLAPIATLKQLRDLDLSGQEVGDLSVVSGLKGLGFLVASNAGLTETTALSNLKLLRAAYLSGNALTDASSLSGLPLLTELSLDRNNLESVDFVADLENLLRLDVSSNDLTTIAELPAGLRTVNASNNNLTSLAPFAARRELSQVNLISNKIGSLASLGSTRHVGEYLVTDNPINCETEERGLLALRREGLRITTDCDSAP